jgi:hypothetical protein
MRWRIIRCELLSKNCIFDILNNSSVATFGLHRTVL